MNWQNFDRLIAHFEAELRKAEPQFDYWQGYSLDKPGCVDCACGVLMGVAQPMYLPDDPIHGYGRIVEFLGVTPAEGINLWAPRALNDPEWTSGETGAPGIYEALRRLHKVAAKYTRPVAEPAAFAADETAFLAGLRELVQSTVREGVLV